MKVPFHRPFISDSEIEAVTECLRSGWLTMGNRTHEFENKFKENIGCTHAIAVNSCTAALHLSLLCIDIQSGDEIIIPAVTFIATAEVVMYFNAVPVLVDVCPDTFCIDPDKIEEKITDKTKAIIPVHYAGHPAEMKKIMEIARIYNLRVIEDAAHSLPTEYHGKNIGTIGDFTCFSFYATKTITTGEGGMITTSSDSYADMLRKLRLHGITRNVWERQESNNTWYYDVEYFGYKYNTTDINASIGIEQMKKINEMHKMRIHISEAYTEAFQDIEEITCYKEKNNCVSSWYLYPILLNVGSMKLSRDDFIIQLRERGIETSVHFIPLYKFSIFNKFDIDKNGFPVTEKMFKNILSLPIFPGLQKNEVDYIIKNVIKIIKN